MTTTAGMQNAEDAGALAATENAHQTKPDAVAAVVDANVQQNQLGLHPTNPTNPTNPTKKPTIRRRKTDAEYVPPHLRAYVFHSQDDFYVSRFFDPMLLAHLMYEGFLPIASEYRGQCLLLPKLHRKRCIMLLDTPEHVPKSVKKRGKKYKLVLNKDFDGVVKGCHAQHGIPWLYPPIVAGFRSLFDLGLQGLEVFPGKRVRFYSVELLDVVTNELVAGELGYTVGKVYTSLTGFSGANGAGTVQLHALSKLLYLSGMEVWDLGMSMPYKMSLGATDEPRDVFLSHHYRWRTKECLLQLDDGEGDLFTGVHVKGLFEISRPKSIGRVPGIHSDDDDDGHDQVEDEEEVDGQVQEGTERLHVQDDDDGYEDVSDEEEEGA